MSAIPKLRLGSCRREWSRYCSLLDLALTYEGQSEPIAVHPPDISPKGMFINTPVHFPDGSVLKITFRLARSNYRIETRGEVRYCMPGIGVGVEFIGLSTKDQKAIADEIRALRKKPAKRHKLANAVR